MVLSPRLSNVQDINDWLGKNAEENIGFVCAMQRETEKRIQLTNFKINPLVIDAAERDVRFDAYTQSRIEVMSLSCGTPFV